MNLQEIITKDELGRTLRSKFYLANRISDVSHTVSYPFARKSLTDAGLIMGFDCSDYEFNQYQRRLGVYK